jgi:NADPH-dependent curcumin reductase
MSQRANVNRSVVLASRPRGAPTADNFRIQESPVPEPGDGQVVVRTVFLSLDPYMRGRMSDAKSYAAPVELGAVMVGGTVGRVLHSRHAKFPIGAWVLAGGGWQDYSLSDGSDLMRLPDTLTHHSLALGVLGMPGFTAYCGLLYIGEPKEGETLVVAAASGAVGSAVGQIAKIKGCRAVGVAGGPDKCRHVVETLGFDDCIDHRATDLGERLAAACPKGIDVYFENVGGKVFSAVLPLLNTHARVPVCGTVANYNATSLPEGPDRTPLLMRQILTRRIRMQGFIIFDDYGSRYREFLSDMGRWLAEGRVRFREDLVDGLETAPTAFIGLLEGRNFGKLIVRVGAD